MRSRELNRQLQRLQRLFSKAGNAGLEDFELLAHWARYLCVLVAGFLENALEEIFGDFAIRAASPQVAKFVGARLASVQNPNAQRFPEIVGAFDDTWRINLESFLAESGRKDAIDSIMANRNQIVHGKDSGITLVRVNQYLEKCVEVIVFLEAQCNGTSQ